MKDRISLPAIGCDYVLPVTLALVAALEEKTGVVAAAEQLVAGQMPQAQILEQLRACYKLAGCDMPQDRLDAHLAAQSPGVLLADIFCAVLAPASAMGAVTRRRAGQSIDITSLRRFFMGVLGWPPDALKQATLAELCDAYLGHAAWHGTLPAATPDKEFMAAMLQQFPDRKDDDL